MRSPSPRQSAGGAGGGGAPAGAHACEHSHTCIHITPEAPVLTQENSAFGYELITSPPNLTSTVRETKLGPSPCPIHDHLRQLQHRNPRPPPLPAM